MIDIMVLAERQLIDAEERLRAAAYMNSSPEASRVYRRAEFDVMLAAQNLGVVRQIALELAAKQ